VGNSLSLARKVLAKRRTEIAEGRFGFAPRRKQISARELGERYIEHAKRHKRSWKRDKGIVTRFMEAFGKKCIDKLTTWDITLYQNQRAENVSRASANRELAVIKTMFRLGVDWGLLKWNPATSIKLFRESDREIHPLSKEQEKALLDACNPLLRAIVQTGLNTGMRRGEIFDLRWEHVDLIRNVLTVTRSKSGRSRIIPINGVLRKVFLALPDRREGFVFGNGSERLTTLQKSFNNATKRAGLQRVVVSRTGRKQRWPRFHDLRHSFASNLVLAGVDIRTVQELLGHASVQMTMVYAHSNADAKRTAVDVLTSRHESGPKLAHRDFTASASPSNDSLMHCESNK